MKWIYWIRLFDSKFQADCLAKRMEEDWWVYGYKSPRFIEVFRLKKVKYCVRFVW